MFFSVMTLVWFAVSCNAKDYEDKENILMALKCHEFLSSLDLSDKQFKKLDGLMGTIGRAKAVKSIIKVTENINTNKVYAGPNDYIALAKKLNQAYLASFASDYISEDVDGTDYSDIVDQLTNALSGFNEIEFKPAYTTTKEAKQNANSFLEMLDIGQIAGLIINYDQTPLEIFEEILDSEEKDLAFDAEKDRAFAKIIAYLGLEGAQSGDLKKKLDQRLLEYRNLEKKRIANSTSDKDAEEIEKKQNDIMEGIVELLEPKQEKIPLFQKRAEEILAYQMSNPEFGNVVKMYAQIINQNNKK